MKIKNIEKVLSRMTELQACRDEKANKVLVLTENTIDDDITCFNTSSFSKVVYLFDGHEYTINELLAQF